MLWNAHLSEAQILCELDGELSPREAARVRAHLRRCEQCRTLRQELEQAIADYARQHRDESIDLPPAAGPRALLKARLEELAASRPEPSPSRWALAFALCATLVAAMFLGIQWQHRDSTVVAIPDAHLTPGATLLETRESVCSQPNTKNRNVPVSLRRQVFEAYGIPNASPHDYEVDYLITPALGGADDIHNLWPQPYRATVWNAEVKDELEDRMRDMVCDGSLDLTEAQQEIAANWIAAYKKYFHTDQPLDSREK